MKEEIKRFLNNETYILAYRSNYDSAREVNQMLIDYINDLQSQLKAKEEAIQNARLWINRKIKSCTIEATSTTTNDICKITLFSLNKLDEILSKGENK